MALLEQLNKLTAQNIFLDENTGGKGRYFKSRFLQAGLVKYSFGVCILSKETIDKFVDGFVGCPVIINHKDVTNESAKDDRVGVISRVWYDEKDGWFWCEGVIFDEEAISLIESGYNVSCQYEITEYSNNTTKALHNGNPYDKVILNGKPEHLAIVKTPRYESAMIAVNALEIEMKAENEAKWITIHPNGEDGKGRHLLLKDGESPKEAIDRVYKKEDKKENKQSDTKEENKDKYIGKKFFIGDREDEITEYLPQFDRYMGKNPEGLNWGAQLYTKEDLDKFVKSDGEYLEEKELREKQKVEREQAQKQKEEEKKATQAEYMRDNGFTEGMTDLQKGKTLKDLNKEVWYKQINDGKPTTSKKMIEELIGKGFKPKEETFRTSKKINGERIDKDTVSKILKDKDGNFYKLNSTEYKYAQYLQDKGKDIYEKRFGKSKADDSDTAKNTIIEAINELKENNMFNKLFNKKEQKMEKEELKSIFMDCIQDVLKAQNEAEEEKKKFDDAENEDEEKEEKAENKKACNEDKRKLIDEVAGMMKSAGCDDEVIRTAIAKMEKIGYDKSEAGTADNCGKKGKNEDEEEKEEALNKAKNSIDALKGLLSQGEVRKPVSKYITKSQAIELGNQLF